MKFKRILSFALAVAMTATLSSVNVFAEKVTNVSIDIDGKFNETMDFGDITLPEIVTKTETGNAFISPNAPNFLSENYNIARTATPEQRKRNGVYFTPFLFRRDIRTPSHNHGRASVILLYISYQ
ncbi:MAG: hypothetical protein E7507_05445 [Ruminococcus sp.]|nr:hypothetical protein [Ruminococcus sp.]